MSVEGMPLGPIRFRSPMEAFDARVDLVLWLNGERARTWEKWSSYRPEDGDDEVVAAIRGDMPENSIEAARLRNAELFWTNPDMTELTTVATQSFPPAPLRREELPASNGIVLFARELYLEGGSATHEGEVILAMHWFERPDHVEVIAYLDVGFMPRWALSQAEKGEMDTRIVAAIAEEFRTLGSPMLPQVHERHPFGEDTPATYTIASGKPAGNGAYMRGLRTFWAITKQRLASSMAERPGRSAQRRAMRAGVVIPEVQVVSLRRQAFRDDQLPESEGKHVDWSHRWIVGQHWRNQWMPSTQTHELRLIAPYIKGPENKPLVADRMYQVIQ